MDQNSDLDIEATEDDEEIYVDYDIATYPSDNTLPLLYKMWGDKDIEIPDFQRGFVWTIKQASLLIESFLRGLPVPPIFFFIDEEHKNLVVDGQQRLRSVFYFYEGYFGDQSKSGRRQVFRLTGLNKNSKYAGKSYKDLSDLDRRKLDNTVLRALNIRQLSPTRDISSVYHIFERLNTGGTPLSAQEIRNTVYRGVIVKSLQSANEDSNWRKVLGRSDADKRGRDTEIVLRLLALYCKGEAYEAPMKKFLNDTMFENKKVLTKKAEKFFSSFSGLNKFIVDELGDKPFSPKGPLNVAILDAIFVALANRWPSKPKALEDSVAKLISDAAFADLYSSRTADSEVFESA